MYIVYLIWSTTPNTEYLPFSPLRKELAIPIDGSETKVQFSKPENNNLWGQQLQNLLQVLDTFVLDILKFVFLFLMPFPCLANKFWTLGALASGNGISKHQFMEIANYQK